MSAISLGTIVVKTMGREAGKKAVVTKMLDKNFVEISGPAEITGVRRRRVNIAHIEPTNLEIKVSEKKNSDEELVKLVNADKKVLDFMK